MDNITAIRALLAIAIVIAIAAIAILLSSLDISRKTAPLENRIEILEKQFLTQSKLVNGYIDRQERRTKAQDDLNKLSAPLAR